MSHNKGGFDFGAVSDRDVIDISDSDHCHSAMLQSLVLMLGMALNSIATVTAMKSFGSEDVGEPGNYIGV